MENSLRFLLASVGFLFSLYALWVHIRSSEKGYQAWCDFGKNASCSRVFGSQYGKLFGIPNPVYGLVWYGSIPFWGEQIFLVLSGISVLASLILAYLLYGKLRDFCIVCTSVYLINILLFMQSLGFFPK
ncbi:vitamin K epoxide reductase family protein [Candidatus Gracilibacteria bacterium]|nr:vitamin K epoxide reductase family protein [Candidatus Gracilibacteria bacterium]MCF7819245.1 vitamin K epoxide reductase family protein [Candidatus Gracilibacteria bacterium]